MHNDSENPPIYSGPIVAASLSILLAFVTLLLTHHLSRLTREMEKLIHFWGYWIPGSTGSGPAGSIGSYSGKETLAICVWLCSWAVFHVLWRKQDFAMQEWTRIFIVGLALITLGFFHPLSDPVVLFLAGLFGMK